jgi:hypothetical protein
MKTVTRLYVMFFLAAALALPSGAFLVHHIFIIKDTAMGMLGEEHLADQRACPERSGGASAAVWGAGEKGRPAPLSPAYLRRSTGSFFHSQRLILHAMVSDQVASVRQIGGRINGASLGERLIAPTDADQGELC